MTNQSPDLIDDDVLDWRLKALPTGLEGRSDNDVRDAHINLFDGSIMYPAATLSWPTIERNSAAMRQFMASSGVKFAPHGKTTMSPKLFKKQLDDGAWGITAATGHHVRSYRAMGVNRIMMANQLVGDAEIRYVIRELMDDPGFDFYTFIDHPAQAERISSACEDLGLSRPLNILIETGIKGGRSGIRHMQDLQPIVEAINRSDGRLSFRGVGCYEGIFGPKTSTSQVEDLFSFAIEVAKTCIEADLVGEEPLILSAGGSGFFDLAVHSFRSAGLSVPTDIVVRSGCYISHDHGMYEDALQDIRARETETGLSAPDLHGALMVWGLVQSTPEPGRVICALGKRDAGTDLALPQPKVFGTPGAGPNLQRLDSHVAVAMNDQHTYLDAPDTSPLQIGDLVGFGVSHPCTTFDKWRCLYAIDENYDVVDLVRTYF
ncbi:MAG: alanine racemase [Pseudomonadota bacterium]